MSPPRAAERKSRDTIVYMNEDMKLIEKAFAELERRGIVARANFLCCTGCACAAMEEEKLIAGKPAIGGVFFHSQDVESANAGGAVYLNHGSFDNTDETSARVGAIVAEVLQDNGIEVEWDGDLTVKMRLRKPNGATWQLAYPINVDR